jgi:hypothetical protein
MSKGAHNVFVVVVTFLSTSWESKYVMIGLFEAKVTSGVTLVVKFKQNFNKFGFTQKILAYVKDEGSNLATCVQVLKVVVSCVNVDTTKPFDGYCFGHMLSKVCQYVTSDKKVACGLLYAFIKISQVNVPKCITWPKKSDKGSQVWEKACMDSSLNPCKLNTPMKTRYIKILHSYFYF